MRAAASAGGVGQPDSDNTDNDLFCASVLYETNMQAKRVIIFHNVFNLHAAVNVEDNRNKSYRSNGYYS